MPRSAQALVRPNAILDWSFKFAGGLIAPCPGQSLTRFGALCILRLVGASTAKFHAQTGFRKQASSRVQVWWVWWVLVGSMGWAAGDTERSSKPAAGSRACPAENLPSPDLEQPVGLANAWPRLPEARSISSSPDSRRKVCSIVCTSFTLVDHDCNIPPHDSRAPQWGRLVSDLNTPWQDRSQERRRSPDCT